MQEQTKRKLDILVKANKINDLDIKFLNEIDQDLKSYDNGDIEEMLLIHIAMVLSRQKDGTTIETMPKELWKQITNKLAYSHAKEYWSKKELELPVTLDKNENQYIIMHLVNIFTEKNDLTWQNL